MGKVLVEFQDPVTHLINTGQLTLYAISTLLSHCDQCDFKFVQDGTLKNQMMKTRSEEDIWWIPGPGNWVEDILSSLLDSPATPVR